MKRNQNFKEGDLVHYMLLKPMDARGVILKDSTFWVGDTRCSTDARRIVSALYYPDEPYYRYRLEGLPHISYSASEFKQAATQHNETSYFVQQIIGKKTVKRTVYYEVWWKGYLKKEAIWEPNDVKVSGGYVQHCKTKTHQNYTKVLLFCQDKRGKLYA